MHCVKQALNYAAWYKNKQICAVYTDLYLLWIFMCCQYLRIHLTLSREIINEYVAINRIAKASCCTRVFFLIIVSYSNFNYFLK